ncbi:MAG: hypothetical protein OEY40_04235 [Candidatus Bathyarchaeota archaeon]|nr:hypothetical protein [Candidatus Bathyarchaeota archaeon]
MNAIKIVDITDQKQIQCPHCGFTVNIPPRTLSMEKLEHMKLIKNFAEWRKKQGVGHGVGNARVVVCPECEQPTICTDQFSTHV